MFGQTFTSGDKSESDPHVRAPHPSDRILEYMRTTGWTQRDIAAEGGLSQSGLSEIMSRKRGVTANMALKLEKATGLNAYSWLEIQSRWDLIQARCRAAELQREKRIELRRKRCKPVHSSQQG